MPMAGTAAAMKLAKGPPQVVSLATRPTLTRPLRLLSALSQRTYRAAVMAAAGAAAAPRTTAPVSLGSSGRHQLTCSVSWTRPLQQPRGLNQGAARWIFCSAGRSGLLLQRPNLPSKHTLLHPQTATTPCSFAPEHNTQVRHPVCASRWQHFYMAGWSCARTCGFHDVDQLQTITPLCLVALRRGAAAEACAGVPVPLAGQRPAAARDRLPDRSGSRSSASSRGAGNAAQPGLTVRVHGLSSSTECIWRDNMGRAHDVLASG